MTLVYLIAAWAVGVWLGRLAWSTGLMGCAAPGPLIWAGLLALPAAGLAIGRRRSHWLLPSSLLLAALLGALRFQLHPFQPCFSPNDLAFYNGDADHPVWATVVGVVNRPTEELDTRQRVRLRVESVRPDDAENGVPFPVQGDALFTVDRYPALSYGDRVAVHALLEAAPEFQDFNYREYLARQGVHTVLRQPDITILGHNQGSPFWQALIRVNVKGQAVIAHLLPEPEAALLTGILLGVETGIPDELYDQFNRTGTSHIIVISGFNITIVAGLFTAIFGRLLGPRRAFYAVVAGILLYTLLVGADAAVTRAAIMGMLVALAAYLGRQSLAIVSLFVAGFVMTLLNPLTLWDVGFQLSFMATLSLILFTPGLTQRFERSLSKLLPQGIARNTLHVLNDALIVTLAASVLTLPLVAYYFGRLSVVAPLANLLVLPVQPYVMVWGGAAAATGMLSGLLSGLWLVARGLAAVPWLGLHWTVLVVQALANLPFAAVDTDVSLAGLWAFYGLVALVSLSGKPGLPLIGALAQRARAALSASALTTLTAGGVVVVAALLILTGRSLPDGKLHVDFLDVERGEAILITTPDGQQVLIDGGYSPTALRSALGDLMPFYDRQIELAVVTHPGDERVGALANLAQRTTIKQALQAPFPYPSAAYESWLRALQARQVPVAAAEAGTRVELGYGIALDVLHPGPEPALTQDGEPNLVENSLVLRLSWGDTSFLLLGDASKGVQDRLVADGLAGPATVVKLPQGGKEPAFSPALLEATQPQHAVVFTRRDDRFRDLSAAVQQAWATATGQQHFHRTDLAGTVHCVSDGVTVTCQDSRSP